MYTLGLVGGEVYIDGQFKKLNVYCQDEKIVLISKVIFEAEKTIYVTGKKVLPGLIDSHVHLKLNVGNFTSADDFETGSKMAALGGVTTILDFLDPIWKEGDLEEVFNKRLREAEKSMVDYGFHCTLGNFVGDVKKLVTNSKEKGMSSIKVFTTYSETNRMCSYEIIEEILKEKILLMAHSEENDLISEIKSLESYEESRPEKSEIEAVKKLSKLAIGDGSLYIVHVSSGKTLNNIIKNSNIFFESCPQYFYLDTGCFKKNDGKKYLLAPPLRSQESVKLLKEKIDKISVIGTDHCPFTLKEKMWKGPISKIPKGIGTLGYAFQLMYEIFGDEIIEKFTSNTAKIFGLENKGHIKSGFDADFAILDINKETNIDNRYSACDYTCYENIRLNSQIVKTILRGKVIMDEGIVFPGKGKYLRRDYGSTN